MKMSNFLDKTVQAESVVAWIIVTSTKVVSLMR